MFDISKFTSVAAQALSDNAEMHWLYQTMDSAADIQLAGANTFSNYFAGAHSLLSEGNIITVRHMSTPDANAATLSETSTVIDEIDYIVIHKGEHRDANARIVKDVYVYPLESGQRILVRKFDDATAFTNKDISFQLPICASKFGVVRLQTLANDLTLTLKQTSNAGTQIGTVAMTAANSANAGYFNETELGKTTDCVEATFNVAGNQPANSAVSFLMYIVADGDEAAHVDQICLNQAIADANKVNNLSFIAPTSGMIKRMYVGTSAAATGANATYTLSIAGNAVTNGVATISIGNKSGVAVPTALNVVNAGDEITVAGTALGAAGTGSLVILIER